MLSFEELNRKQDSFWTNLWFVAFMVLMLTGISMSYLNLPAYYTNIRDTQPSSQKIERIYFNLGINLKAVFDHSLKANKKRN